METMIPAWKNGQLQPVEKLLTHQLGLRHKAISVFIMRGEDILLQQRAASKYHTPNLWANTCCTHPHWGEDDMTCAIRRLRDELGLISPQLIYRAELEYKADVGDDLIEHEVVQVFTGYVNDISLHLNPDEVQAVRWVSISKLYAEIERNPEIFTPWLRIYMKQHAAAIFDK